jgi:catechol 2,3-dioxygenase-like lactoylglutathione lyase family enzyme
MITRREAMGILGAGVIATRVHADDSLSFVALDHIEINVPNALKSAMFYAHVFGAPIWKNNKTQRRYVKFGPRYIAIEQREPFAVVDHFSAGIQGFQIEAIHSYLTRRGIAYKDYPSGKDLNVTDPDGIHLQLSADFTWGPMEGATASPEPVEITSQPIFQPTGLDHILLNVSDPEKSAAFYEKILGPVSQRNNNRIWFQVGRSRVGLLKVPSGQKPGVNHFCVAANSFEYAEVTKKLEAAGAHLETPEADGLPEFRDPDNLLVQVETPKS